MRKIFGDEGFYIIRDDDGLLYNVDYDGFTTFGTRIDDFSKATMIIDYVVNNTKLIGTSFSIYKSQEVTLLKKKSHTRSRSK